MKLSKDLILDTTEAMIVACGFEATTLSKIAKQLDVSHAALYKYYRNKEDLFENLALRWLTETSQALMDWDATQSQQPLHDWLWQLAMTKKELYREKTEMFLLYTQFIEHNEKLVTNHLNELAAKIETFAEVDGLAMITAFTAFHNPYFAPRWLRDDHQAAFERVWQVVAPNK